MKAKSVVSPSAGITGAYEPLNMEAGSETQPYALLTAKFFL